MSNRPPPPMAPRASESCPLCGESFFPAQGHVCQDQPTAGVETLEAGLNPRPQTAAPADMSGAVLADRYEIIQEVSRGGMGVVYKARHKVLNNLVAVKVLLKPGSETDQRRFLQEAQLASKINHPNTVYISDFGVLPDGKSYLAMEFLEGPTLTSLLRKEPKHQLDMLRACRIACQIALGMQNVHDKGIVHRDLKPENIFILGNSDSKQGQDFVKIVDFGIAKDTSAAAVGAGDLDSVVKQKPLGPMAKTLLETPVDELTSNTPSGPHDSAKGANMAGSLTQVGASLGTPRYMAPEQVDGKGIGPHTDQYALGCILYQMICGHVPFSGPSSMALLSLHMFEPPTPLRQRNPELKVPESLDAVVLRMLAKKPAERFASMRDVATALEREIEVLSLARGEKVAVSAGLAALLGGRQGTHIIIRGRKIPLVAVAGGGLGLLAILSLVGVLGYRSYLADQTTLKPGEMKSLEERARKVLVEDLHSKSVELRTGAMTGLAQTHDNQYRAQLEENLTDAEPSIQAQAADALSQLGDRQAVPALLELMKRSQTLPVKLAAAHALTELGEEQGQQLLEGALEAKSEELRLRAAALLCERGHAKALEVAAQAIEKKRVPEAVALNLLTCLSHSGNEGARQQLRALLLKSSTPEGPMLAAAKLAQLGQDDGRAFLRERIRKPGPEQLVAARFLAAPDEPQVADLFRQVLRDARAGLSARLLSVEGLGLSGQLIDARLLGTQLDASKDAPVRDSAASSIVLLARNEPSALSDDSMRWARNALADSKWAIRESAVAVLGDSASADAVPLLGKLLKDDHPQVRQSAARALGRRREEAALLVLRDGLRDPDPAVRQEALRSLLRLSKTLPPAAAKLLSESAGAWMKETLASGSDMEKALARSLLLRLGDRGQLDALRALARSASEEVRQLVVEGLGRELEVMSSMLQDSSFGVRFGAARQLAEAGDRRSVPILKEALERKTPESLLALTLLRKLGEKVELPAGLVDFLVNAPLAQRLATVEVASKLPADLALTLLRPLAHDVETQVRRRVAEAAAELPPGPDGAPGFPILRVLTGDSDASVRARAAVLLSRLLPAAKAEPVVAPEPTKAPTAEKASGEKGSSGSTNSGTSGTTPTTATNDSVDAGAGQGPEATPPPSEDVGSGFLTVEAEPLVEFSIDHGRWQSVGKGPIPLAAGPHEIAALSGVKKFEVKDKKTTNVEIPESPAEKLTASGLDAVEKKDNRKAQKLLEKAAAQCGRERKHPQPCNDLSVEINFRLGQIHESAERFSEAMSAYQKVAQLAGSSKSREERRSAANSAMARLAPNLGMVVIPRKVKNKCQEVTLYMLPGTHQIEIEGEEQTVKVRAQETVRVGSCN